MYFVCMLYILATQFNPPNAVFPGTALRRIIPSLISTGIITAIAWPSALISVAGVIDNPWHVCTQRASEAGKQLAEVLLAREQGNRPVTLVGFSLGARVIFSCLEEMSKRKGGHSLFIFIYLLYFYWLC